MHKASTGTGTAQWFPPKGQVIMVYAKYIGNCGTSGGGEGDGKREGPAGGGALVFHRPRRRREVTQFIAARMRSRGRLQVVPDLPSVFDILKRQVACLPTVHGR